MFDIKQKSVELKETCNSCGKPTGKGSITGWIVGSELQSLYDRWGCTCASETSAKTEPESGLSPDQSELAIGRWLVKSLIGSGYLGNVYLAEDTANNEKVSIRIFNPLLSQNRRIAKRFLQEAEKAATLTHRNIAMVYEQGTLPDGRVYVVSEYVEGVSLREKLKEEGFLDVQDALTIVVQLCDALEEAHKQSVLHRSIKPSKILIQPSGSIKLIDFGLEKAIPVAGKVTQCLSQVSGELGNPRYMSPEQCLGETLDERSDLYSIGCAMYEMLTGKEIFEEHKGFLVALAQLREEPQPFSKVMYNSDIPASVEAVVRRMLEKTPDDRYRSAKELREDIEAIVSGNKPPIASQSLVRQKPSEKTSYPARPRKQLLIAMGMIMGSVLVLSFAITILCYSMITAPSAPPTTAPLPAVPTSESQHTHSSETSNDEIPASTPRRRSYSTYDSYYGPSTIPDPVEEQSSSKQKIGDSASKNRGRQSDADAWSEADAWKKFRSRYQN